MGRAHEEYVQPAASDDRFRAKSVSEYVRKCSIQKFNVYNVGRQNSEAPVQHVLLYGTAEDMPGKFTEMFCSCGYSTRYVRRPSVDAVDPILTIT